MARAATPAITALLAAEIPHEVLRYHHDPQNESFGEEAVNELAGVDGVDPEQVYKTLIIALPKGLAVAVVPVPAQLSLKAAAAALGVAKATWDRVLCSAGKRGWDVAVHPQDLIRLTNAVTADIRA